jgi:hypothetical protein
MNSNILHSNKNAAGIIVYVIIELLCCTYILFFFWLAFVAESLRLHWFLLLQEGV